MSLTTDLGALAALAVANREPIERAVRELVELFTRGEEPLITARPRELDPEAILDDVERELGRVPPPPDATPTEKEPV